MKRKQFISLCSGLLGVAAIAVGAFFIHDHVSRKRALSYRTACVGSLVRINITKSVYAEQHGLPVGAVIPDEIIWGENGVVERCMCGGIYSINPVGVYSSCSYTGVVRWNGRLWRHVWPE